MSAEKQGDFRFTTGEIIDSRYEVLGRIGSGGMGELYKVRHLHLHDVRAIKLLRKEQLGDETFRKRFLREARIAASIKHPNVALHHDFASLSNGSWYMVLEFIEGTTLARAIHAGRRFSLDDIVSVARQSLLGLGAIHGKGIIHRDISPDNIMLTTSDEGKIHLKIIDLGIARPVDVNLGQSLTSAGLFVGKPHYASPEQLRLIESDKPIDHRTDLYSLGVVLWEMVSGKVPFEASTPFAYLMKQLTEGVSVDRNISDLVPPDLEAFIIRLLRAKPEDRFQSTNDAVVALTKMRFDPPTLDQQVPLPPSAANFPQKTPAKRSGTAEVPIDQLKELIEKDRGRLNRPVSEDAVSPTPSSSEGSERVSNPPPVPFLGPSSEPNSSQQLADSAGDISVAATQITPPPQETPPIPPSASPHPDQLTPLPQTPAPQSPSPQTGPLHAPQQTHTAVPHRQATNPIIYFVAGAIFIAIVAVGGYFVYRWLDATFGQGKAGTAAVSATEPAEIPAADTSSLPPVDEIPTDSAAVTESPQTTTNDETESPVPVTGASTGASNPAPTPAAPTPEAVKPPPRTPVNKPLPPPAAKPAAAAVTPPPATTTEDVEAADTAAAAETTESESAAVVVPEPVEDVREGDVVAAGPGVTSPKVLRTVEPIYPPLSANMKHRGTAMFSVLVGPTGKVEITKLIVSTGLEPLDESATESARQTIFSPAMKDGKKVRMWTTIRVTFKERDY